MPGKDLNPEDITEGTELPVPEAEAEAAEAAGPEPEPARDAAPSREAPRSGGFRWWLVPLLLFAAFAVVCGAFCWAAATRDVIAPHTFVGELDVSGLTRSEARDVIAAKLDALLTDNGIRTELEDGSEAAFLSYKDLGVAFDADALADEAYAAAHSGEPLLDGWALLRATFGTRTELAPEPVSGWTVGAARLLAEASDLPSSDFSWTLEGTDALKLTKERDGRRTDESALRERLLVSSADRLGVRTVPLPYTVLPGKAGDLRQILEELGGEMVNASYDVETDSILPERSALNFDLAEAQAALDAAAPGETIVVPAEYLVPTVTAAELEELLFRDVLGSYTTRVGGAAGRKSNVRLTASRVNGTVLNSGEEFNYYKLTGPFSAANGYLPAPGYLHGKTVDMDGGGACQCCSTSYAAALMANLEIVTRTAHGFASDYIGLGLDATVSGGGPDMIFRNNTPYPIKIEAIYSDSNRLTVNILGTKTDDITVKMRTVVLSTTPYEEEIVEDPALAPGERVVDTTPYTGYTVNTYRQLYDGEGNLISETFEAYSKYNKRNRIIHVGPAVDPTPVTPDPTPVTPDPAPVTPDPAPVTPVDPVEPPIPDDPPAETPEPGGEGA